jgi:hypothetical protein
MQFLTAKKCRSAFKLLIIFKMEAGVFQSCRSAQIISIISFFKSGLMKKLITFFMAIFFVAAVSAQDTTNESNIKKVIEGETLAFANADLVTWSDYFVHKPYVRWSVSPKMYFDGWDALYQGARSFLESNAGKKDADALHKINRTEWNIHINGDVAFVKFVQTWDGNAEPSQQFRVLERVGDKWKIAMLIAVQ